MQNRYVGDTGDFAKYFLLKKLTDQNLKLGVNWCLVKDESHNEDGKHIGYLSKNLSIFKDIDETLYTALGNIIEQDKRSVAIIESSEILQQSTVFYSTPIPKGAHRFEWHAVSLKKFKNCDLIFYDPDNGLEVGSCGKLNDKAIKYTYLDELKIAFDLGKSIVVYQHTNRSKSLRQQIKDRIDQVSACLGIDKDQINIASSSSGSSRFFIIVKQLKHEAAIEKALSIIKTEVNSTILEAYESSLK